MKEKELKVGIITTCAIIILLVGLYWLTNMEMRRNRYFIEINFSDASGLKKGDPALVFGIKKGGVDKVALLPDGVRVRVWLEKDVLLRKDAKGIIESTGLFGERKILIIPGTDSTIYDREKPLEGKCAFEFTKILSSVSELAEGTAKLLSLIKTSKEIDLDEILSETRAMAKSLKTTSDKLGRMIEKNRGKFEDELVKLNRLTAKADTIIERINRGEGTAGKFLKDETLYNELTAAAKELREVIKDFKENPRKYIKIF